MPDNPSSHHPQEEGSFSDHNQNERKSELNNPEFLLIDDRNGEEKIVYFNGDSSKYSQGSFQERKETKQAAKNPFSLRFICLLGLIFCLIFGFGMLVGSIVMTFLAIFSLFQNKNLNQRMRNFWKFFINASIAGFGFTLGLISPTLGLGLLAIYFSLAGNLVEDDLLRKVIRRSFNHL